MQMTEILKANLLNPIALSFALGVVAKLIRSEFSLPKDIYTGLSIFLLFGLGLKGGVELAESSASEIMAPTGVTPLLGVITPLTAFGTLRYLGRFSDSDAAGIAAHYGSVSAVTFIAARNFIQGLQATDPGIPKLEGYLPTLLAVLESPGIHVALALGAITTARPDQRIGEVLH